MGIVWVIILGNWVIIVEVQVELGIRDFGTSYWYFLQLRSIYLCGSSLFIIGLE